MNCGARRELAGSLHVLGETSTRTVSPEEVGAKAYNLMRLAEAELPIPPGFVLDTHLCRDHPRGPDAQVAALVARGIRSLEQASGSGFGAPRHPLLVSVRSGAAVSMPGMLDTILNIGLNDATAPALLRATGDPVFVWDSYRRLLRSYGEIVAGCPPSTFTAVIDAELRQAGVPGTAELDVAALRRVVAGMQDAYRAHVGRPFPQDPMTQLLEAIGAVWRSWGNERAVEYRAVAGLTELAGTAVTVQQMVFGNLGGTSGSGVGFTRNPATGQDRLYLDFLLNAQGEDVVAGRHSAGEPELRMAAIPGLARELGTLRHRLEALFLDVQDFEFTVQDGRLWLLQTRNAQRTPLAAVQIACDLVNEGLIAPHEAVERLHDLDLDAITRTSVIGRDRPATGHGTPAGAGVVAGRAALTIEQAHRMARNGDPVVLVRYEALTDDIAGLANCRGLLTALGARTCHAAVVARQLGVVTVVGCRELSVDPDRDQFALGAAQLGAGDLITVDGNEGLVYVGALDVHSERPVDLIERVRSWQTPAPARTPP